MGVESAADRAAFLDPGGFGETLTWSGGPAGGINVLADTGTVGLHLQDGAGALTRHATLQCAEADIGFTKGGAVTFRAAAHTVKAIEPDGTGMAIVRLELDVED